MTSMSAKLILIPITKIYIPCSIYEHTNTFAHRSKTTFARTQSYIYEGPWNVLRMSTEITAYIMKYSVKWREAILYTAKFPITFHLRNNFMFMLPSTGDISMTMVHPMKNTFPFVSSIFPFIHAPTFPNFFCIRSPTLALFCHPIPHRSFNIFIFKFFMVTDYNEVLSIGHTYTEQKANFQTPRPSVSITVSVPYLWSVQLSHSLHLHLQFCAVKLAPAQE